MVAREVEEVANDRIAVWTRRKVIVFGFGDPMNREAQEGGTCDRDDEFCCDCEDHSWTRDGGSGRLSLTAGCNAKFKC